MKKIGITAIAFTGNQGAEAMLVTTIRKFREKYGKEIKFFIFTPYPGKDRKAVIDPNITILSSTPISLVFVYFPFSLLLSFFKILKLSFLGKFFPKNVYIVNQLDMLIDLAGVSFIDGREKFLPFNILTIWPAILLKVPVIKMAQAMGPFKNKLNKISAKYFLRKCKKVFARGKKTFKNLESLNIKNFELSTDVAFLNKETDSLVKIPKQNYENVFKFLEKHKKDKIIGICPSSVVFKKTKIKYLEILIEISNLFLKKGWKIVLFPNANRDYDINNLRNNDLPLLKEISNKISNKNLISITNDLSTREIKYIIGHCDLIITSRFHAMIGALSKNVPPIVLGWSHKYAEIMKNFNLEDWVLDYSNVEQLTKKVLQKTTEINHAKEEINKNLKSVKNLSKQQFDYLFSLLS